MDLRLPDDAAGHPRMTGTERWQLLDRLEAIERRRRRVMRLAGVALVIGAGLLALCVLA